MRSLLSFGALALAVSQTASAFMGSKMIQFAELAEKGLLPDGTPMTTDGTEEVAGVSDVMASLNIAAESPSVATPKKKEVEKIQPEYVELPIDNFAKNNDYGWNGYFYNRYWVAQSAYKPGAPVFIYDAGEADAAPNALFRLQNETSFFKQIVDKYNGIGIVWEHRYYGNSTPEPISQYTPPDVFKFLTSEQALADVDRFAKQFSRKGVNYDLTPSGTPWIFVGGSYPGMRAAFMRDRYPDTIFASYASSAPVEARNDMSVYFEPVWRGMNAYGWGNCTQDIKAAINYMDNVMENPYAAGKLKEQFLGLGAANNSNAVFGDALSTIFWAWQSYGIDGGSYGLRNFCDWISTDPTTNKTAPAKGWAATKGANFTVNRWAAYPKFVSMVNDYLETDCSGSPTKTGKCNLDQKFDDPASVSWTWQYCTEWGFLQSANLGQHQLISKYNSLRHQRDICHRQWPTATPPLFPDWPRDDATNDRLGGWDIRPSNVYWSGGEFDPWRTLSPLSSESFAPKVYITQNIPRCGEETRGGSIFGYVMKGAQHCYDFRTTFKGGEVSRKLFTDALDRWLPCFKPKKGGPKGGKGH